MLCFLNLVVAQAVRGAAGGCNSSVSAGWRAPIRRLSEPQCFSLDRAGQLGAGAPLDQQWHEVPYRTLLESRVRIVYGRGNPIRR
jgi:hypothetical protein